ncbi:uncharacterized protein LOC123300969 isoform X2 [Chrysoperla carnea]|uniref:uncharacterized protein LOC123300969 isoform X2 n=1 Tax=Chrysoperla carnea TaxID=189513 RepID=UPI001D07AC3B|nr:uncharacterized protein LOC123300969 isoform X2 [Chrysoperla carnea]
MADNLHSENCHSDSEIEATQPIVKKRKIVERVESDSDSDDIDAINVFIAEYKAAIEKGTEPIKTGCFCNDQGCTFAISPNNEGVCWVGKFLSETNRKYLVQRIVRWDTDNERQEVFRKLCKNANGFGGQLLTIFDHPKQNFEHIHVIHDCNKPRGKCRCAIISGINSVRYPRSIDKQLDLNSTTYIHNLRAYASKDDRRVKYIRVKRSDGRLLRDHAYYPCKCGYEPVDPEHSVLETCETRAQIFR